MHHLVCEGRNRFFQKGTHPSSVACSSEGRSVSNSVHNEIGAEANKMGCVSRARRFSEATCACGTFGRLVLCGGWASN